MRLHLSILPPFLVLYLGSPALSFVGDPPPPQASPGAVAVGFAHVCTLEGDGAVGCWGTNAYGQLGDGGTDSRAEPAPVSGGLTFQSMSVGHGHGCGVAAGGTVHCWGTNGYGELGDGSTTNRTEPVAVAGELTFVSVVAGTSHTCALTGDGEAYCWGLNSSGQLGVTAGPPSGTPVRVPVDTRFESIAAGVDHTCALASNERATCWGSNDFGELGDSTRALGAAQPDQVLGGRRFEMLSAGNNRTCGVTSGDDAYCWGNNNYGGLGDGTEEHRGGPAEVSGGHDFSTISAGGVHTCALTDDGEAYCWGLNTFGQLGDGTTDSSLEPVAVAGGHDFESISAGSYGTCALTGTGEVYCWGRVAGMAGYEEAEGMTTEPTLVGSESSLGETGDASGEGPEWAAVVASLGALHAQTPPRTIQPGAPGEGTQESRLTNQCHDITVFPEIGLAAGACAGNGILLDISDPVNPIRLDEVVDPNFAYWHSATFNNDGSKILFTDEWGGGGQPRCRSTDPPDWGANPIFAIADGKMELAGYYKLPVPQSELENCVAHNGAIIPVPGRDIMVQAWYQGGLSMLDFTDASDPVEIAFFDRGPQSEEEMYTGGYWSTYWNNGFIYGAEITRGLDIFQLAPSEHLSQNEIDAANMVQVEEFNAQLQPLFTWPAHVAVAGSYLDQLERAGNIQPSLLQSSRAVLAAAESSPGADVAVQLRDAAAMLDANAAEVDAGERLGDAPRQRQLAQAMRELAEAME